MDLEVSLLLEGMNGEEDFKEFLEQVQSNCRDYYDDRYSGAVAHNNIPREETLEEYEDFMSEMEELGHLTDYERPDDTYTYLGMTCYTRSQKFSYIVVNEDRSFSEVTVFQNRIYVKEDEIKDDNSIIVATFFEQYKFDDFKEWYKKVK